MFSHEKWLGFLPKPFSKVGYLVYVLATILILGVVALSILYFKGGETKPVAVTESPVETEIEMEPEATHEPPDLDRSDPVVSVEEEVISVISVDLKMTGIKGKNAVNITLKNTADSDATYKLRSMDLYEYKIYVAGSSSPVKSGTHGTLAKEELVLKSGETKTTVFDYSAIYNDLQEGHYTIEITPNSFDLDGFKTSQSFAVSDFVDEIEGETLNGNFIIREIVTSPKDDGTKKFSAIGVLNGVTLITVEVPSEMKEDLTKFKPDRDILYITYSSKGGVNTLKAFEEVKQ